MEEYIPSFTDITDWDILIYQSTGGTRSKNIAIHPKTNDQYFFKGSKEIANGEIRYPQEFWSEIVASKIGQFLGFNMLDYNIAYNETNKQKIGCLSKSMVVHSDNKLTEGVTYLTGFDSKYRPDVDDHKKKYTFQFICLALESFSLEKYIDNIVEVIVFDSIVGNSDRHQENWGIITNFKKAKDDIDETLKQKGIGFVTQLKGRMERLLNKTLVDKYENNRKIGKSDLIIQSGIAPNEFAPIYDSGCCLGRENLDEKIHKMLNDKQMVDAYIRKGVSEIHWNGEDKKKNHFELIDHVKTKHQAKVLSIIQSVKEKFNADNLKFIIDNVDLKLPENLKQFKLEEHRKELMFKLITLRLELLFKHI